VKVGLVDGFLSVDEILRMIWGMLGSHLHGVKVYEINKRKKYGKWVRGAELLGLTH
jgi:hypothetical protein